jgi:hypothetical protein
MLCVGKENVRRDSVNLNPVNTCGKWHLLMAFFAICSNRNVVSGDMALCAGNAFFYMLRMRKLQRLSNCRAPSEINDSQEENQDKNADENEPFFAHE